MATYNQVSYGSQGSDVTELQKLLNKNGYTLDEDGIFGDKTQAAVKDYQQKNSLDVDGIVGNNTWGALTKVSTPSAATPSQNTGFQYGDYQASDTVKQAEQMLQQQLSQKPGAYQSQWQDQLNEMLQKIMNREDFSYDLNGDALYQQYKDQYTTQGQMAMMDTMGQAAALTGGYGNSYGQNVGQQAYQGYLQQLNDRVPELYQLALNQYNQEGQEMKDQASMLGTMEDQEYGRYRDQVSEYYTELDRLTDDARYQGELDYGKYIDNYNKAYGEYRDTLADQKWQAEFDEAKRQYDQQYALANKSSSSSETSSNPTPKSDPKPKANYNNLSYSDSQVKAAQRFIGVAADGKWGPESAAAAKKKGYGHLGAVIDAMDEGDGNHALDTLSKQFSANPTYSTAVAYIKGRGKSASGLMTSTEWTRHRNSYLSTGQGNAEARNYSSYAAYLKDFVEYATGI